MHTGFDGQISAHAALKLLTIRQYSLRALPCLNKNLLRQNCKAPVGCAFRDIFGFLWCRWAGAHQGKKGENSRKGTPTGDMHSALVSLDQNTSPVRAEEHEHQQTCHCVRAAAVEHQEYSIRQKLQSKTVDDKNDMRRAGYDACGVFLLAGV